MKIKNYFAWMIMAALSVSFVSCSDDDDNENGGNAGIGNIGEVFPNGSLSGINRNGQNFISNIAYDNSGRVTSMKYGETSYKIEYISSNTVRVTCFYEDDTWVRDFSLGSNGYISGGSFTDEYGTMTMSIGYDAQGRITSLVSSSEDYDGSTSAANMSITYDSNGDMINYTVTENDTDSSGKKYTYTCNASIGYTDDEVTTPIVNKGNVMLFDEIFGLDLDEDICLYYAGLLGKSTAHLPLCVTTNTKNNTGYDYTNITMMTWTLNSNNYPTSVTVDEDYYNETFTFVW